MATTYPEKITKRKGSIKKILVFVDACIVLHNILTRKNEPIEDEWLIEEEPDHGDWTLDQLCEPVPVGADDDTRRTQLLYYFQENIP